MHTVNLMPPGYAVTQRSKRRMMVSGAVLVAAVLALVGLARLLDKWGDQRAQTNSILEHDLGELKAERAELGVRLARVKGLSEKCGAVRTLNQNRRWSLYLSEIARVANSEVVLARAKIGPAQAAGDDSGAGGRAKEPGGGAGAGAGAAAAGAAPTGQAGVQAQDEAKPEKLVLLLDGYALSTTDVTRFIAGLDGTGIFERVTFKCSQTAQLNGRDVSRFELECPIRYEVRKRPPAAPRPAGQVAAAGRVPVSAPGAVEAGAGGRE